WVAQHTTSTLPLLGGEDAHPYLCTVVLVLLGSSKSPCLLGHRGSSTPPSAFIPPTTRGTGVSSQLSARQWLPQVWHTPRYPGGGHPLRRRSSKNKNTGLS